MAAVAEVTDATFTTQVLQASKPVLVDYWADWCAPCKQIAPILEELAQQYGDRMTFLKMDTNTNPATAAQMGVMGLPTLQVFVDGMVVKSVTGAKPKGTLIKLVEEFI